MQHLCDPARKKMQSIYTCNIHNKEKMRQANLILVILASQSVKAVIHTDASGTFTIQVEDIDIRTAENQLRQYQKENVIVPKASAQAPTLIFFSPPAIAVALFLAGLHYFITTHGLHRQAVLEFGSSSYYLHQGQSFRAVTALFLHSNTEHLLGNMAGILVLAGPLLRLAGYGTGLLLLLAAGTTGNLLSESVSLTAGLSIGASTAVMAAAGLLAAHRMTIGTGLHYSIFSRVKGLAPFAAATTLAAMFSHGENTDVSAHLFGFLAGTGIGLCYFPLSGPLSGPVFNRICLGLVAVIMLAALLQGMTV